MPKISVHLGVTLPGPSQYSSFRADVEFYDIDTDSNLEEQISACSETAVKVTESAEQSLAQQASNLSGLGIEGLGFGEQLKELQKRLKKWADGVDKRITELEGG